jgi:hypothetical protein
MKNILRLVYGLAAFACTLTGLRADGGTPPASAATQPQLIISLPANLKAEDVVNAVNKGFNIRKWSDIAVDGGTVTAAHSQSGVSVKARAVCTASEVMVFADYKYDSTVKPDRAKAAMDRWLRSLEKSTKEELGLLPKKGEKKKAD